MAASSAEVQELLEALFRTKPEVLEGYLFGSLARGDDAEHSDVDVAVFLSEAALREPGFGVAARLAADVQGALGRSDIDLVVLNQAPPLLYHRVLRDGVRVFTRNAQATTTREGQALSRYCDYVPQLRKIEAAHRARLRSGEFGK